MKRILIVDDQQAICTMVRAMFEDNDDYRFAEAHDVIMPDCDGIELIMTLFRKHPDLKIIVISGGGRVRAEHYLNLAEKLGATCVFEKPLDPVKFRKTVEELLNEPSA